MPYCKISVLLMFGFSLIPFLSIAQEVYPTGEKETSALEIKEGSPVIYNKSQKPLENSIDLEYMMPVAGYQGKNKQSCWAFATTYALRSVLDKHKSLIDGNKNTDFKKVYSPEYVYQYYNQGNEGCDFTARSITMLGKILQDGGVKYLDLKYSPTVCTMKLDPILKIKASKAAMPNYEVVEVNDIYTIKKVLNDNIPLVLSVKIDKYFQTSGNITKSNPFWKTAAASNFSHAMVIVGYREDIKAFKVLNSWGVGWGDRGYVWISYSILEGGAMNYACYVRKKIVNFLPIKEGSLEDEVDRLKSDSSNNYISSWAKKGYFRRFNNYKIIVSKVSNSKDYAVINIRDDKDVLKYNFFIQEDSSKEFYIDDRKYRFTLDAIDNAGYNFIKKAAYFTMEGL